MKKLLFLSLFLAFSLSINFSIKTYAQDSAAENIQYEEVNPDREVFYKVKRLKEKLSLLTKITPRAKAKYYEELSKRRLAELTYVVKGKNLAYIETSSQRYETTVGRLTELVVTKRVTKENESVQKLLSDQLAVVDELKDYFPYDTAEWRFVMNDYNSIKIYMEKLQKY